MNRKVAIITGATSGIGKSFAIALAKKGNNLLITGRRELELNEVATYIRNEFKVDVTVSIGDLSSREYVAHLCEQIGKIGEISYLINNAGYGNRDSFFKDEYCVQEKMLDVHINALTKLVHLVGNKMKIQKEGYIINTSSLASFFPIPNGEFYTSTKAFINTFSESIHIDLRRYNVKVQCLCPGFTYTDFHRKLHIEDSKRENKFLIRWMSSDDVVAISLKNLKKFDKVIVVPGLSNKVLYILGRLIPKNIYYKVAANSVKIPGKKEE